MRYYYIDVLKILSAFLVVLLHTTGLGMYSTDKPDWWIFVVCNSCTRFAVPLFVLCSGAMVLQSENNKTRFLFSPRFNRIMIPLLFWSLFYELHLINTGADKTFISVLQDFISGNVMYHLWFMYMLMSVYIISPILHEINLKIGKYIIFVWIIFCIFFLICTLIHVSISPYIFYLSPYVCYFYIGYWIHMNNYDNMPTALAKWINYRVISVLLLVCLVCIAYGTICVSKNSLNEMFFSNGNFFVVIGSLIIFYAFRSKEKIIKEYCNSWIPYFSSLTFGIYLIHVYVLDKLYYRLLGGNIYSVQYPILAALAISVLVFFISMVLTALLKKCPGLRRVV